MDPQDDEIDKRFEEIVNDESKEQVDTKFPVMVIGAFVVLVVVIGVVVYRYKTALISTVGKKYPIKIKPKASATAAPKNPKPKPRKKVATKQKGKLKKE